MEVQEWLWTCLNQNPVQHYRMEGPIISLYRSALRHQHYLGAPLNFTTGSHLRRDCYSFSMTRFVSTSRFEFCELVSRGFVWTDSSNSVCWTNLMEAYVPNLLWDLNANCYVTQTFIGNSHQQNYEFCLVLKGIKSCQLWINHYETHQRHLVQKTFKIRLTFDSPKQ